MGIGTYRHYVTLEHPAVAIVPPLWACAVSTASQVSDGQVAFYLRGRYHPGIQLDTRVIFEGRTLQVQSVADTDERHIDITVLAVEVVARGHRPA